jgi:hypothetical protein
MADINLEQLFRNLDQFNLESHIDDATQACQSNFKMSGDKVAENPFLVIAMYQAMGVGHMAQGQQAILAELKNISKRLEDVEKAIEPSGDKISEEIDKMNFNFTFT